MHTQEEYRAKLEALRATILTELESIAVQNNETGDWEVIVDNTEQSEADENSEADAAEDLGTRTAILAELETTYRNIERALQKLLIGTYGRCEICEAAIDSSRLLILPSARTCSIHFEEEATLPL